MKKKSMNTLKIIASVLCLSTSFVAAETVPGTNYDVHLESANIIGTGRSINIHRVPVIDNITGNTIYYDVSFKLTLDGSGRLVFENFSQINSPAINSADNFISGVYKDAKGNKYMLSGPSILSDGREAWSLTSLDEGRQFSASWITGNASGNPLIGTRMIVSDLQNTVSYGVQGNNSEEYDSTSPVEYWRNGGLIGAQQVGDSLVLYRYHSSITDKSTAQASFNLIRVIE